MLHWMANVRGGPDVSLVSTTMTSFLVRVRRFRGCSLVCAPLQKCIPGSIVPGLAVRVDWLARYSA
jgi:hypothetical protein